MNLTLPGLDLPRRGDVPTSVARFEQWMAVPDSPIRAIRCEPARPGEFADVPGTVAPVLRDVVIDELHYYRGVYGSHLANLLRRLKRICGFYGSSPQFICCSATIANPKELAEALAGASFELIDRNGAPSGAKYMVFYNPPVVN